MRKQDQVKHTDSNVTVVVLYHAGTIRSYPPIVEDYLLVRLQQRLGVFIGDTGVQTV